MLDRIGARMVVIGLTAFAAGSAITAAIFEGLVFTDFISVVVLLGLLTGFVLVIAAAVLMLNPQTGGLVAMLGGLVTVLFGVVEIAVVGLVWQSQWQGQQVTQPVWIQELFNIVVGAVIGGIGLRLWQPREGRPSVSPLHPA